MRFKNDLDRNCFWNKLVVAAVVLSTIMDAVLISFFLRVYH